MPLADGVFARRRRRFMEAMEPGAAAIFAAAPEAIRSNDVEYRYRQSSDLHYLTGFTEPGAVCLLLPGHPREEYVLFVRPRDPEKETWTGRRFGVAGALERFGASAAHPVDELDERILAYLGDRPLWYYALGRDERFNRRVLGWFQNAEGTRPRTGCGPTGLLDPREILHEMRLRKEEEEIEHMRRAAAITAEAHLAAMRGARAGQYEYEVEALLDFTFRRRGAAGPAYPSIVAAGANGTILHYTSNHSVLRSGDLVLVDAGAEFDHYCGDVTRTWPVDGRFAGPQRDLYEIVLRAQRAAIGATRPGVRLDEVHELALGTLIDGLRDLGLLAGSADEIREKGLYRPFFMHRTGHWLGMDVHDVGKYRLDGESRKLEPGMVVTCEPGLYLGEQVEGIDARWKGLAVRIEDDVLITQTGHDVLTDGIPKDVAAIEALRAASVVGDG